VDLALSNASLFSFPVDRFFALARKAGFTRVEVMVTRDPHTRDPRVLQRLARDNGIRITSIHAPFLWATKKVWGYYREKVERSVELAQAVGAQVVVAHLPYLWDLSYARWLESGFREYSLRCPVTVALENSIAPRLGLPLPLSRFQGPEKLLKFPHLVFDTSHFAMSGRDIFRMWELLGERVVHVHLSNNYLRGLDDHALPHEGFLPLGAFLRVLRRDGFPGSLVLELSPTSLEARLGEGRILYNLRRSLEFCREHLEA